MKKKKTIHILLEIGAALNRTIKERRCKSRKEHILHWI